MRDTLNVKEGAKFIYFHEFTEENKSLPHGLFDLKYSEQCVFIKITLLRSRTVEQKKNRFEKISSRLGETNVLRQEDLICCVMETDPENWSFGSWKTQFLRYFQYRLKSA